ncbi:MAG: cyclic nucleotide-binding domain-containing protein [Salaquimonas sp.]|jgi:CRP-like cAMP-binding protein|nr:cyclic nucleotide-binding domain-containing protein [Salaquimonas sp.]
MSLLARVGLFQGFSSDQLRLIAFGAERERLPLGAVLFSEGDEANGGYVVAEGQVDLMSRHGQRQIVIETVEEGGLIGEIALIAGNRRSCDAVARVGSEVLYIARPLFLRLLREYPETAAMLHGGIAQSIQRLMSQMTGVHDRLGAIAKLAELQGLGDTDEPDEISGKKTGEQPK